MQDNRYSQPIFNALPPAVVDDLDGIVVLCEWDFEDDGTYDYSSATSGTTDHTYAVSGVYTARLRVTDDEIRAAYARLASTEGVFCEPASAASGTRSWPSPHPAASAGSAG